MIGNKWARAPKTWNGEEDNRSFKESVCACACACVCVCAHASMHRVMVIVVWRGTRLLLETTAQDGQGRTSQEAGEGPGTSGGGADAGCGRSLNDRDPKQTLPSP